MDAQQEEKPSQEGTIVQTDLDGDGFVEDDCNDTDATINPSALELCDGFDNNCDGNIDEDVTTMLYPIIRMSMGTDMVPIHPPQKRVFFLPPLLSSLETVMIFSTNIKF